MSSLWTITDLNSTVELEDGPRLPPIHPGEILMSEFMEPLSLSASHVAGAIEWDEGEFCALINGERDITGDLALRLGHAFSISPDFWMNLQSYYSLEVARRAKHDLDHLPVLHAA